MGEPVGGHGAGETPRLEPYDDRLATLLRLTVAMT